MVRSFVLVALLAAGVGCGGDGDGDPEPCPGADSGSAGSASLAPNPVCEPGRVGSCPCAGKIQEGTQTCAADGSAWGACACDVPADPQTLSPQKFCAGPITERPPGCTELFPAGWATCDESIVESGKCRVGASYFCCEN